jgi:hypothetical protein
LISYKKVLLEVMESLDFDNLKDLGFDEANTGFARLN